MLQPIRDLEDDNSTKKDVHDYLANLAGALVLYQSGHPNIAMIHFQDSFQLRCSLLLPPIPDDENAEEYNIITDNEEIKTFIKNQIINEGTLESSLKATADMYSNNNQHNTPQLTV